MTMPLRIHAISDTHNSHEGIELPGGDILIHAGDATGRGTLKEVLSFLNWLSVQDYKYKIFVPGNHDWFFQDNPSLAAQECRDRDIVLLNDSGAEIAGINFWGSPITPTFYDWAFNRDRGHIIRRHWDMIPDDTEVLITHGPAYGILDTVDSGGLVGCYDLWERVKKIRSLKLHICGHIHHSRGHTMVNGKLFVNAASVDESYWLVDGDIPIRILKDESGYIIEP